MTEAGDKMPIRIDDLGSNNQITISPTTRAAMNGVVQFVGRDSSAIFHDGSVSEELYVHIGNRVRLEIGPNCRLGNLQIYTTNDNNLVIGANAAFTYKSRFHMHEPSSLSIGAGALFSDGVYITTSDMHSIIDVNSGRRINHSKDVHIGENVWLGTQVTILKGVDIGAGSIIGACSVVTSSIPAFSVAAGQPARVRRSGVTWRPDLI